MRGIPKFLMPYKTKQNKTAKTLAVFLKIAVKMSDDKHLEQTNFTTWRYCKDNLSLQNEKLDEIEFN